MKVFNIDNKIPDLDRNIACIGYFDGLHKGHKKLIDKTLKLSKKYNLKSALITFNPDPLDLINNHKNKHIYSRKYLRKLIEEYGFDYYICMRFDEKLMNLKALDFINEYLNKLNIHTLVCGFDFRFGYKAKGNYELLNKKGNFNTIKIDEYQLYKQKVSSTRIKDNIIKGNFKLVYKLLGNNYKIVLKVLNSSKKGLKTLIEAKSYYSDVLIPIDGKYDGFIIKNKRFYIESNHGLKKGDIFEFIY